MDLLGHLDEMFYHFLEGRVRIDELCAALDALDDQGGQFGRMPYDDFSRYVYSSSGSGDGYGRGGFNFGSGDGYGSGGFNFGSGDGYGSGGFNFGSGDGYGSGGFNFGSGDGYDNSGDLGSGDIMMELAMCLNGTSDRNASCVALTLCIPFHMAVSPDMKLGFLMSLASNLDDDSSRGFSHFLNRNDSSTYTLIEILLSEPGWFVPIHALFNHPNVDFNRVQGALNSFNPIPGLLNYFDELTIQVPSYLMHTFHGPGGSGSGLDNFNPGSGMASGDLINWSSNIFPNINAMLASIQCFPWHIYHEMIVPDVFPAWPIEEDIMAEFNRIIDDLHRQDFDFAQAGLSQIYAWDYGCLPMMDFSDYRPPYWSPTQVAYFNIFEGEMAYSGTVEVVDELFNGAGKSIVHEAAAFVRGDISFEDAFARIGEILSSTAVEYLGSGSGSGDQFFHDLFDSMANILGGRLDFDDKIRRLMLDVFNRIRGEVDPAEEPYGHGTLNLLVHHLSSDANWESLIQRFATDYLDHMMSHISASGEFSDVHDTFEGDLLLMLIENVQAFVNETTDIYDTAENILRGFIDLLQREVNAASGDTGVELFIINLADTIADNIDGSMELLDMLQDTIGDVVTLLRTELSTGILSDWNGEFGGDLLSAGLNHLDTLTTVDTIEDFENVLVDVVENYADLAHGFVTSEFSSGDVPVVLIDLLHMLQTQATASEDVMSLVENVATNAATTLLSHLSGGDLADISDSLEGDLLEFYLEKISEFFSEVEDEASFERFLVEALGEYATLWQDLTADEDLGQTLPGLLAIMAEHGAAEDNIEDMLKAVLRDFVDLLEDQMSGSGDLSDIRRDIEGDLIRILINHADRYLERGWLDLEGNLRDLVRHVVLLIANRGDLTDDLSAILRVTASYFDTPWVKADYSQDLQSVLRRLGTRSDYPGEYMKLMGLVEYLDLVHAVLEWFFSLEFDIGKW